MTEKSLTEELAARVREAVAETAPTRSDPSGLPNADRDVGRALARAQAHATPSVPDAAPMARWKRLALRALRFLWRDQASFNALTLEAATHLADAMARERRERAELEARVTAMARESSRRAAIEDGRLAALETATAASLPSSSAPMAARAMESIPDGVYALFEERFRGSPDEVEGKQRSYLPLLRDVPGPVLDAGCGRGEFLRLLSSEGIAAQGVEINALAVAECRRAGLKVQKADALAALRQVSASSLGAVVAFQVVEHWTPETTFAFLRAARRALAPGGVLICETVNVATFSAWRAFWLDPSHVRPVPPEALEFLASTAGFVELRIEPRSPLPATERLEELGENERKLNRLLYAAQDYALIARAPEHGSAESELETQG